MFQEDSGATSSPINRHIHMIPATGEIRDNEWIDFQKKVVLWRKPGALMAYLGLEDKTMTPEQAALYEFTTEAAHEKWMSSNIGKRVCGPEKEVFRGGVMYSQRMELQIGDSKYQVHPGMLPVDFMREVYMGKISPDKFYVELVNFRKKLEDSDPQNPFLVVSIDHLPRMSADDPVFYERWIKQILQHWATANDSYYKQARSTLDSLGLKLGEIDEKGFTILGALERNVTEIGERIANTNPGLTAQEIRDVLNNPKNKQATMYLLQRHKDWREDRIANPTKLERGSVGRMLELSDSLKKRARDWLDSKQKILLSLNVQGDGLQKYLTVQDMQAERESWHREANSEGNRTFYSAEETFSAMLYLLELIEGILANLEIGKFYTAERITNLQKEGLKKAFKKLQEQLHYDLAADANAESLAAIRLANQLVAAKSIDLQSESLDS